LAGVLLAVLGCSGDGGTTWAGPEPASPIPLPVPPTPITGWGDSMIADYGPTTVMPVLAQLLERPVYAEGVGGESSSMVLERMLADTARHRDVTLLWMGRNNFTDPAQVKRDIATAVASLAGAREFLVLSVFNADAPEEWAGQPNYVTITTLDRDLAALYPNNFLDLRSLLVSRYDPAVAQDVIDHGHDVSPSTLRADGIHLNAAGNRLVAEAVAAAITARGW
jgi:lysophospholipase L1-like esterase